MNENVLILLALIVAFGAFNACKGRPGGLW
jgi:hypothetical protein